MPGVRPLGKVVVRVVPSPLTTGAMPAMEPGFNSTVAVASKPLPYTVTGSEQTVARLPGAT